MATLTTALNATFTPAAGDFIVQSSGNEVVLERRNSAGAAWVACGRIVGAAIVSNPVAGADYRLVAPPTGAAPTVQADQ